ncbi:MAG: NAD(P)-binding domain-containing protein, partial [Roseicyclus sp.]|nr:NAD(P)-binding domain-containing protein [Roseicyclus sp.]
MQKLGVIGLGRMGSAIAERLAGQGVNVTGWTRSGLGSAGAAKLGIARAETLADLAAGSDILITSLYDDIAVGEVLDTLATLPLTGKLIIDTSTITPSTLTSRAEALKADLVDAPIAGGPEMVLAGSCSLLLGGAPEAASRAL